jgi:RNA polymerase sigma-70 factor (ECF subfamily)
MKPSKDGGAAAAPARHITPDQIGEVFYGTEYRKLVKILRVMGATKEEAEDAAQRALEYIFKRSRSTQDPIDNLDAYACRAAIRFFIKERQHDRGRQPREIEGGHLTLPAYLDDELTAWEDKQWVEHVLESLTPAQRDVIRLVLEGASNMEIAEKLGKNDATVRQHLHNARDQLKEHPEIAPRAPREPQPQNRPPGEVRSATPPAPRKEEVQ